MDIKKICEKSLFRYNEKSKCLLEDSLDFDGDMLLGNFTCYQPYLKDNEMSAAMNNTDFMTLSNQACYLIIYCYFIKKLGYSLEEITDLHGNIAIYKQDFFSKIPLIWIMKINFKLKSTVLRKKVFVLPLKLMAVIT